MPKRILIVGFGVVGYHLYEEFPEASLRDPKYSKCNASLDDEWDFIFICVPTPNKKDSWQCDTSIVLSVLDELRKAQKASNAIVIIKSTVPPGFTKKHAVDIKLIFSPEYYGVTQHAHESENFVTLGGNRLWTEKVAQLYMSKHDGYFRINQTDSTTAELVKYMTNAWLANQVTFANEFYRIANRLDVSYTDLRELFVCDSRVSPSHTFVYEDQPYWDSHCLNKDVRAITGFCEQLEYDPKFLRSIIDVNEKFKQDI